ncbi:MAG: 50S ribosomal protein L23 [Candidatus Saccharimonadales bacterium]
MFVLKPRLSEKSYATSKATNTFVFDVPSELNKQDIASAVEKQFEVTVADVRIVNRKGKIKRTVRKGGRASSGRDNDIKKAYVSLAKGSHLPFFEAAEEEEAKVEATQAKIDKAVAKAAKKEKK